MTNQLQLTPTNNNSGTQQLGDAIQFLTDSTRKLQR